VDLFIIRGGIMNRIFLDCKGQNCPLPIVNVGRALRKMEVGQILEVEADDLAFKEDILAYVRHANQSILSMEEGKVMKVVIRKER
jgi:tRNA 2-thiouridine synthesizing protein A